MEKMLVPSNFMSWPRIRDLLPDQKLIARELWCNQFVRMGGAYILPIPMFSASLSIAESAILAALVDFEKRELIAWDEKTGEIYNLDWLRVHTFKPLFLNQYFKDLENIQSEKIKKIVGEKTKIANIKKPDSKPAPSPQAKPGGDSKEIDEMIEALTWHYSNINPEKLKNQHEFSKYERARLKKGGFELEDYSILKKYKYYLEDSISEKIKKENGESEKKLAWEKKEKLKIEVTEKLKAMNFDEVEVMKDKFIESIKNHSFLRQFYVQIKSSSSDEWSVQVINEWIDWLIINI